LTKLPLDQLKIDQSFVRNVVIKSTDAVIVQTIIVWPPIWELMLLPKVWKRRTRDFLESTVFHYQDSCSGKPVRRRFESALIKNVWNLKTAVELSR